MWQQELPTEVPGQNPYASAADVQRGKRLFAANCAVCHGPEGAGGRGANLAQPALRRAADDRGLFLVIRQGVPGTEMPPAWWVLNEHEIWQVAAYVRSLGRVTLESVPGDTRTGGNLFRTQGCVACHQVGAEGGRLGPPLTDIGTRRGAAYLRAKVIEPAASLPEEFLQVQIVTRDGKRLSGIRLNEDNYSIQVRDLTDQLHSFWKDDLTSLERQPGRSPMPSYRDRLADRQLDDVVAYLVSLRGDR
jgi:cytochrome c oxidase cbb3-type subunit 3